MAAYEQGTRLLALESPLGDNVLLPQTFEGREELSRSFEYQLGLVSTTVDIHPKDLVGSAVKLIVHAKGNVPRPFHGYVASFTAGALEGPDLRRYRTTLVPWTWFLRHRTNCRIFQEMSVIEIAETLFGELQSALGQIKFEVKCHDSHPKLPYCVQYRESDFDFLSRLFEEAGIFYYFRQDDDRHVLVLGDAKLSYFAGPDDKPLFQEGTSTHRQVSSWEHSYEFVSGKITHTDYDYEAPRSDLAVTDQVASDVENGLPKASKYELYDYPGEYKVTADGKNLLKVRLEERETAFESTRGSGDAILALGGTFSLDQHPSEGATEYVVTSITHAAAESSLGTGGGPTTPYRNEFTCIPSARTFRPARITPKAVVEGPQTALVVGPEGEEIYTDELGRIKIQFHWDREGKKDEKSSCWVRVSYPQAGKGWGAISIPRIGQEVVVDFLEGDPDRPLVVGRVYNGDMGVPYKLPDHRTQSGFKSRSSLDGDPQTFNELRFEDKKGEEEIYFHAEKDQSVVVENDQGLEVGHDRREDIGNDRSLSVGANKSESVGKQKSVTVGEEHTESVGKNMTISVGATRSLAVSEDAKEEIGKDHTLTVGGMESTTIGDDMTLTIGKDATIDVGGAQNTSVAKEALLSAKKVQVTAKDEISFKTGSASIVMKKNGDITIKGKNVTVQGSGKLVMKGSQIAQN